jgi:hypothetical protein
MLTLNAPGEKHEKCGHSPTHQARNTRSAATHRWLLVSFFKLLLFVVLGL